MPGQIATLREIAKKNLKNIVLPEGTEPRILRATEILASRHIANVTLISGVRENNRTVKNLISKGSIRVVDPKTHPEKEKLIDIFFNLRKHKGITPRDARKVVAEDPVYFGALLVKAGLADGFVAGASRTTSNVARAALYCIGIDKAIGVMSSSFAVELEDCPYGEEGLFIFGDCGIVPNPGPERLAGIAISSSALFEDLFKRKARVALLSYSTKGSARGESVEKVIKALRIIKEKKPDLDVDGELQLDAAIIPEVAKIKSPGSHIAGKANVLIFPNLDAGNIAYKMMQRLGRARAVGPLLEGLQKPCSDLSRGCSVEEIVDVVAATAIRAAQC